MGERVDITIGIHVEMEELEKASARLKEFTETFQRVQAVAAQRLGQPVTEGLQAMGNAGRTTGTILRAASTSVADMGKAFGFSADEIDFCTKVIGKVDTHSIEEMAVKANLLSQGWTNNEQAATNLASKATSLFTIMKKLAGFSVPTKYFEAAATSLGTTPKAIKEMSASMQEGERETSVWSQAMMRLGQEDNRVKELSFLCANAFRLEAKELTMLSEATGMTVPQLENYSRAQDKMNKNSIMARAYTVGMRGAIGPLGMAFRDITMQLYWASLGFLFLTMTMTRHEKAALAVEQRTNDLAKAYYNLSQLQRDAVKASIEYGAGSDTAKDAQVRILQAQRDLELQQKSLGVSIKQDILQGWQMTLSIIPLTVNTMYGFMTAMGALNGIMSAHRIITLYDTLAKQQNAGVTAALQGLVDMETGSEVTNTVVKQANAGATTFLGKVQGFLTAMLHGSTFAANLLTAALTLGIGVVVAFAVSSLMAAQAEAETQRQTKKMTEEAEKQANAWKNLSSATLDLSKIFARYTVILKPINKQMSDFTEELEAGTEAAHGSGLYDALLDVVGVMSQLDVQANKFRGIDLSFDEDAVQRMSNMDFSSFDMMYNSVINVSNALSLLMSNSREIQNIRVSEDILPRVDPNNIASINAFNAALRDVNLIITEALNKEKALSQVKIDTTQLNIPNIDYSSLNTLYSSLMKVSDAFVSVGTSGREIQDLKVGNDILPEPNFELVNNLATLYSQLRNVSNIMDITVQKGSRLQTIQFDTNQINMSNIDYSNIDRLFNSLIRVSNALVMVGEEERNIERVKISPDILPRENPELVNNMNALYSTLRNLSTAFGIISTRSRELEGLEIDSKRLDIATPLLSGISSIVNLQNALLEVGSIIDNLSTKGSNLREIRVNMNQIVPDRNIQFTPILDTAGIKDAVESDRNLRGFKLNFEGGAVARTPELNVANVRRVERGDITVNVTFPNMIVKEEQDIKKIASEIDKTFQYYYYGVGGTPNV